MYKKQKDGTFIVESRSKGGASWIVSSKMDSCNCPKYKFFLKGRAPCHHIEEVIQGEKVRINKLGDGAFEDYKKFDPSKYKEVLDVDEFIKIYGDEQLEYLKGVFELFEDRGRVRKL